MKCSGKDIQTKSLVVSEMRMKLGINILVQHNHAKGQLWLY